MIKQVYPEANWENLFEIFSYIVENSNERKKRKKGKESEMEELKKRNNGKMN